MVSDFKKIDINLVKLCNYKYPKTHNPFEYEWKVPSYQVFVQKWKNSKCNFQIILKQKVSQSRVFKINKRFKTDLVKPREKCKKTCFRGQCDPCDHAEEL